MFNKTQLIILAVYLLCSGICVGKAFTKNERVFKRTLIAFVPVVNFCIAFLIIALPIIDRLELYIKEENNVTDSTKR